MNPPYSLSSRLFFWMPTIAAMAVALTVLGLIPSRIMAHEPAESQAIGVDERLGDYVPMDIELRDESGRPVRLADFGDRPIVLSLIYFSCPNVCPRLTAGVGDVLSKLKAEPGKDYAALTVSFDEHDTPVVASEKKTAFLPLAGPGYPASAWRFLTSDAESIHRLTAAVGFRFSRAGEHFRHPVGLVVLAPGGKIVRYLHGDHFLPFDLKMALAEASEGRVGVSAAQALLFCFSYDPEAKKYVFNLMRVYAIAVTLAGVGFFFFLNRKGRPHESQKS